MSLARALSGEQSGQDDSKPTEIEERETTPAPNFGEAGGLDLNTIFQLVGAMSGSAEKETVPKHGNLQSMLGGLDPRMLQIGMRVLQEYGRQDDDKVALLTALRPFVKEKRYAKIDRAVQIARMSRMIRVALEAFRQKGDGEG